MSTQLIVPAVCESTCGIDAPPCRWWRRLADAGDSLAGVLGREPEPDGGALAGVAVDPAPAVGHGGPLRHAGQAEVAAAGGGPDPLGLEAGAVVRPPHQQPALGLLEVDLDPA